MLKHLRWLNQVWHGLFCMGCRAMVRPHWLWTPLLRPATEEQWQAEWDAFNRRAA